MCGEVQADLAKEKTMYEMFIDDHVVLPLQTLVEVDSCFEIKESKKKQYPHYVGYFYAKNLLMSCFYAVWVLFRLKLYFY